MLVRFKKIHIFSWKDFAVLSIKVFKMNWKLPDLNFKLAVSFENLDNILRDWMKDKNNVVDTD